jgi:methyl-accepting chemotaxis protein
MSAVSSPTTGSGPVRWLRDRSVRTKIMLAVLVVAVMGAGVGGYAVTRLSAINGQVDSVYGEGQQTQAIATLRASVDRTWIDARDHFLALSPQAMATLEQTLKADATNVSAALSEIRALVHDESQSAALGDFDAAWTTYLSVLNEKLLPASRLNDFDRIAEIRQAEIMPLSATVRTALDTVATKANAASANRKHEAGAQYRSTRNLTVALLALALVLGFALAMGIAWLITGPLQRCVVALRSIGAGDLTARADVDSRDELVFI